jgi:hypothetical protein
MALQRAPKSHDWAVAATSSGDPPAPVVIAVCRHCGLVRSESALPGRETKIDVSGECPGWLPT